MNRCTHCKFWGVGYGYAFRESQGVAGCSRILCPGDPANVGPPAALEAYGDEWEDAILWTSPDFGCALWEEKK
jgi:hypothetical protein